MTKSESWRYAYRQNRYMEHISQKKLEERTIDIFTNMMTLSEKGQISLHGINELGEFWMIKWTQVLEEFSLRFGPYPNGFTNGFLKEAQLIKPSHPHPPKAKIAIDKIGGIPEKALFKFGKAEHLNDIFHKGEIRVAPASYYNDPSLNKAIKDNELSFTVTSRPSDVHITNSTGETINPIGNIEFTVESTTNYYVFCFAQNYTYREYDDFEADTCIIVREPEKLLERMIEAFENKVDGFTGYPTPVKYLDPLQAKSDDVEIFMSKHFRYAYQNEYRIIWFPHHQVKKLEPVYIDIGSIESFADIIYI